MKQKEAIISKVNRSRKGSIFMPDSFLPIDTHYAANILGELCASGKLMRIATGIYIKPIMTRFGPVMPTMREIAEIIAKRDSAQVLPSGAAAENLLGLSTQVPMNSIYLTSGTPRKLRVGKRTLTLKRSAPRTFAYQGELMPVLVLALKSIKQENLTDEMLATIYRLLRKFPEEKTWQKDVALAPRWIRTLITDIKERIHKNGQVG